MRISYTSKWITSVLFIIMTACIGIGDVELPPPAPVLLDVVSPTSIPKQEIGGTKTIGTAVLNQGEIIVPHNSEETWSYVLNLEPDANQIILTAQTKTGLNSKKSTTAEIVFEPPCPTSPTLESISSPTNNPTQTLLGTKPTGTSLELWTLDSANNIQDITQIKPPNDSSDTWSHVLTIQGNDNNYAFALVAKDNRDKSSAPVNFVIQLDRQPPEIVQQYPVDGDTDIPTNTIIEVALDGPLAVDASAPPSGILILTDGAAAIPGTIQYHPLSHSLIFKAGVLLPNTTFTVKLVASEFTDSASNQADSFSEWTFTTGDATNQDIPNAPQITDGADSPTTAHFADLQGTKDTNTSVWINGLEVVPITAETTWNASWTLGVDVNDLTVLSKNNAEISSSSVSISVVRNLSKPNPPIVEPAPPNIVDSNTLMLFGTKDPNTALLYNGEVVICRTADVTWGFNALLIPGTNQIELRTQNADGIVSDPLMLFVTFEQTYSGSVPSGYQLYVSFVLRDMRDILPISSSFDTGPNRYSVDVWIEGPLEQGETCEFDSSKYERKNIKLTTTIKHYKGNKPGHTNPFSDADYRAPDFLAALITKGALSTVGLGPSTDRRDNKGYRQASVLAALDLSAVDAIDETCSGRSTIAVDGCTEATVSSGLQEIQWIPIDEKSNRLEQGDYLLHIVINLDRDPTWVAANDFETCWSDSHFSNIGPHRIVRRLSLGEASYSLKLGALSEESGKDSEPAATDGQLRYITSSGIRIRWGS